MHPYRGMHNLTEKFIDICDYWIVINNSGTPYSFIAEGEGKTELRIHNGLIWQQIKNHANEEK